MDEFFIEGFSIIKDYNKLIFSGDHCAYSFFVERLSFKDIGDNILKSINELESKDEKYTFSCSPRRSYDLGDYLLIKVDDMHYSLALNNNFCILITEKSLKDFCNWLIYG